MTSQRSKFQTQDLSRRAFLGVLGASGATIAVAGIGLATLDRGSAPSTSGSASTSPPGTDAPASAGSSAGTEPSNTVAITTEGSERVIRANGIPVHPLDPDFTYRFGVAEQTYEWRVPLEPQVAGSLSEVVTGQKFGVSIEGVPYDPATAAFWNGDRSSGWLQDAQKFPLDVYGAHVQPGGVYHYHQYPEQWDIVAAMDGTDHGVHLGWAADGFPIYARYGYRQAENATSGVTELRSSWRLRSGARPANSPGGTYDGTWVQDYEYVVGAGDLDRCNGRTCVTPEHPDGTYAYFVTREWPFVPRWIRGTVNDSFRPRPPGGGR